MNYITRRTKKGTVAVPLTNFIFSLKYFIGGLFGLHFNRTASEYSAVPAIYLRQKSVHILYDFLWCGNQYSLTVFFTLVHHAAEFRVLEDLSIKTEGSIYLKSSIAHTKIVAKLKRKRVLMWIVVKPEIVCDSIQTHTHSVLTHS